MHKPLSLLQPQKQQNQLQYQKSAHITKHQRADAMVCCMTSYKNQSPFETILIESKQIEVSIQLQALQLKVQQLENKMCFMTNEHVQIKDIYNYDYDHDNSIKMLDYYENQTINRKHLHKENMDSQSNKAGQIVKKLKMPNQHLVQNDRQTISSHNLKYIKTQNNPTVNHRRNKLLSLESQCNTKSKQLSKLKRQLSQIRQSVQKTQRAKSLYSERLSQFKQQLKHLTKQNKRNAKILNKLKYKYKKSENISQKQKMIIQKQEEQILSLKLLVAQRS